MSSLRRPLAVGLVLALLVLHAPVAIAQPSSPTNWLTRLNYLRAQGGLDPVVEHPTMSDHALLAAEYIVANNYDEHDQPEGTPLYTPEGDRAAEQSNFVWGYWSYDFLEVNGQFESVRSEPEHAIDGWMTSPGHFIGMVDDRLTTVGFGYYADPSQTDDHAMAAVLHSYELQEAPGRDTPFLWPADGAVLPHIVDPFGSCGTAGTALIHVGAAMGGPVPTVSATRSGTPVDVTTESVWDDHTWVGKACVAPDDTLDWTVDFGSGDVRTVGAAYLPPDRIPGYPATPHRTCPESGAGCPVDVHPRRGEGYDPCPHPADDPTPCTPGGADPVAPTPAAAFAHADPIVRAVDVSTHRFADRTAALVVLARVDQVADSLAASSVLDEGPLLLSSSDALSAATREEVLRVLAPGGTVLVMGGEAALSAAVEEELESLDLTVQRIGGTTRIETALQFADYYLSRGGGLDRVLLARAFGVEGNPTAAWADAIAGGALAADDGVPVLLTPTESLDAGVAEWLRRAGDPSVLLLGGTAALSPAVSAALPSSQRLAGASRDETAREINLARVARDPGQVMIAFDGFSEGGWVDGLLAAGLAADTDGTTLLVTPTSVPPGTAALRNEGCVQLMVVGPAVGIEVTEQLGC